MFVRIFFKLGQSVNDGRRETSENRTESGRERGTRIRPFAQLVLRAKKIRNFGYNERLKFATSSPLNSPYAATHEKD